MAIKSKYVWLSLKMRLTILALGIMLLCIWSLAYYASHMLRNDLQQLMGEQQFNTATILAEHIHQEIDFRLRSLENVAKGIPPVTMGNAASLQRLLADRPILASLFNGGYFVTKADGTATASLPLSANRRGVNYIERDHIAAALKEGRSTVSKPVIGKMLHAPVVSMAAPILDAQGHVIGALAGVVDLSRPNFFDEVTNNRYGNTGGYVLIAPQHKLFVTATDKKLIMKSFPPPGTNLLFDRYVKGYEGSGVVVDSRGVEVLSSAKQVPAAGWILVARIPTKEAFASINKMQKHILVAGIILTILAGGATWWILRLQLTPMLDAVATLSVLSDADLPMIALPIVRQDEVGQLISSFNRLLDALALREARLNDSEETISASNKLLHSIINTAPLHIFWKDTELRYLGGNAAFAKAAGLSHPHDLVGKDDYQLAWKDLAEIYRTDDRLVIETGIPKLSYEEPLISADGGKIWIRTSKVPLINEASEVFGILGLYEDITEWKLAEDALLRSEKRLKEAQRIARIGDWELDLTCNKLVWSDEIYRIFEIDKDQFDATYEAFLEAVHPDDREAVKQAYSDSLSNKAPYEVIHRLLMGDGRVKYVLERCETSFDKTDQPLLSIGTVQDVTQIRVTEEEKVKLENQLHQAQKMESVGRLAGGVAHDFNNMLTVISGYSNMGFMEADPSTSFSKYFAEILKTSERSAVLTHQLLAFARKQTIAPQILNINEAVTGMFKMLQRLIGEDIHLNLQPDPKLWPVKMDPSQIDQILANLCVNARDAITDVGTISIETGNFIIDGKFCADHAEAVPGEYVRIAVCDSGCGIDDETLIHIFEPFFTTKGLGEGTGLGLATVFGIVKQNNGFIYVSSELGNGTTFYVYLPRYVGEISQATKEGVPEPLPRGDETILMVEDELSILNIGSLILSKQGYSVLQANSPAEAIRLAKEQGGRIHLLITDVIMPEMNGKDLAINLLSMNPKLKCLYMSGYTADAISQHGVLDAGVNLIQKPFSLPVLTKKVREILDGKS